MQTPGLRTFSFQSAPTYSLCGLKLDRRAFLSRLGHIYRCPSLSNCMSHLFRRSKLYLKNYLDWSEVVFFQHKSQVFHNPSLVCASLGLHARKTRPTQSYLRCSPRAAQEEVSAVQEGWQLLYFCLKRGYLQEPAGTGNKSSLCTFAPKNKATMDLLP